MLEHSLHQTFQIAILIRTVIFYEISLINKKKVLLATCVRVQREREGVTESVDATDISDVRRTRTFPFDCPRRSVCNTYSENGL